MVFQSIRVYRQLGVLRSTIAERSPCCRLQLGPSVISPGLRERVLDQLSMHFQLLVQTGILAAKVGQLKQKVGRL